MAEPTYSYLSPVDLATQGTRGWAKLNTVAEAMTKANALSLDNTLSTRQIARLTDNDPGNMVKFLKDKPGFVAVRKNTGHSLVGAGYYYAMQFASYGQQQGGYYPRDFVPLMPIASSIPRAVILPEDEPVEIGATVQVDPRLAGLLPNADGHVSVPVQKGRDHKAVVENVSKFLSKNFLTDQPYEALLEMAPHELSDAQLSELLSLFGRLAILVASGYTTLDAELNSREVR